MLFKLPDCDTVRTMLKTHAFWNVTVHGWVKVC